MKIYISIPELRQVKLCKYCDDITPNSTSCAGLHFNASTIAQYWLYSVFISETRLCALTSLKQNNAHFNRVYSNKHKLRTHLQ